MGALVLLHIVLARKGFVARWAENVFLARVFLAVTCSVARSGEGVVACIPSGVRTRIFLLDRFRSRAVGGGGRGRSG